MRILGLLLLLALPACRLGYIVQQGWGQWQVLSGSREVEEVLADPEVSPEVKYKIAFIQEVAQFGEEVLGLARHENYTTYFDTGEEPVSYNIFACPKTALVPVVWTFPIVGSVPYLGFFDREDALAEKKSLEEAGLDVHLGMTWAYSTLGYFRDPIFSSMIKDDEVDLARYILHEMTHGTIFRPDEAAFNESLATFVGNVGAAMFLEWKYGPDSPRIQELEGRIRFEGIFESWFDDFEGRLKKIYESEDSLDGKLARRQQLFRQEKQELLGRYPEGANPFAGIVKMEWNNALFLAWRTYRTDLDVFERFFREAGARLPRFMRRLERLPAGVKALDYLERKRWVRERRGSRG